MTFLSVMAPNADQRNPQRDDAMSDDVTKLPVKFKHPPSGERTLEVVDRFGSGCNHSFTIVEGEVRQITYLIDEAAAEVECSVCKAKLNPMWVLARLAHNETKYHETARRYHDEMKRLAERSRTRCDHCGKMTRISRS
jgi:hypothetical protein